MIPDYQTLMLPLLECSGNSERRIGEAVERLADKLGLSAEQRVQLLPLRNPTELRVVSSRESGKHK
jgi:restriction system protein